MRSRTERHRMRSTPSNHPRVYSRRCRGNSAGNIRRASNRCSSSLVFSLHKKTRALCRLAINLEDIYLSTFAYIKKTIRIIRVVQSTKKVDRFVSRVDEEKFFSPFFLQVPSKFNNGVNSGPSVRTFLAR